MFIKKMGEEINVLAIARKHEIARVLMKLLKKLGVALHSCFDFEMQDFEAEANKVLTQWLSHNDAKKKEFEGYLARYATQLAELRIIASTMEGKPAKCRNDVAASFRLLNAARLALLKELWQLEVKIQNINNEISALTTAIEKLESSIQFFQGKTIEELRAKAAVNVKMAYEKKKAKIEATFDHLV